MTDTTTRDPDVPPDGLTWCESCEQHWAVPGRSPKCVCCDPASYGYVHSRDPHQPAPSEEAPCPASPSETPTDTATDSATTPTDDSAASTGTSYPVADSPTHMTLLSIARRWMSL